MKTISMDYYDKCNRKTLACYLAFRNPRLKSKKRGHWFKQATKWNDKKAKWWLNQTLSVFKQLKSGPQPATKGE